jgi:hypothetical protein
MTQELRALPPPPPSTSLRELTLDQLRDTIVQCLLQGAAGHYRIGQIYNHMVDCRRAVNAGYRTTREYFRRHVRVLSQSNLTMFGAVVRRFSPEVCEKYGMASLGGLLEYQRLTQVRVDRAAPGDTPIEIPRKGGLLLTKPFGDCTLEDLRQAVLAQRAILREKQSRSQGPFIQAWCDVLQRYFAENAHGTVAIHPRYDRWDGPDEGWKLRVSLENIPLADLEDLTDALRRSLKPS